MPEQMLRYRAAAFWQRTYAPEVSMGLRDEYETRDITVQDADATEIKPEPTISRAQKSLEAKKRRQEMAQALDNATEAEKEVAELQAAINAEPEQPNTAAVQAETAEPQPMAATRKSVHEQAMEIINRQKQQQSEE